MTDNGLFTADEERVIRAALNGCPRGQRRRSCDWLAQARVANGLLENLLDGAVMVVGFSDGEPEFRLTAAGRARAEELAKEALR